MTDIDALLDAFRLEPAGEGRFRASSAQLTGGAVVFGGQLLGQSLLAGATVDPDKEVKSVHIVFARGASLEAPLDIEVDVMSKGRAFASSSVTIRQGDRLCTRAVVLLTSVEPDLIRHQDPLPDVGSPQDATPGAQHVDFWQVRTVGGTDISDPATVAPAELDVWTRFEGAPDPTAEQSVNRALLAFATDGFLIGTAMLPHEGVGQSMAHVSISTSVIGHTISFHEPVDAGKWMLLAHRSPYAGRGRSHGTATVFSEDGRLVATFSQDNMVRDFPQGSAPAAGGRASH